MKKYDYLITGAGITGCVIADKLSSMGKKILLVDQRNHLGGLCYTEKKYGIHIHKYGAHILHTSNKLVWDYISNKINITPYEHRVKTRSSNSYFTFPINLSTLHTLWGVNSPKEARQIINQKRLKIPNPQNAEEAFLAQMGTELYEKFYYSYTKKQWNVDPKSLPPELSNRIKIRTDFNDAFFLDKYQGLPSNGFDELFDKLTEKCDIYLQTPYNKSLKKLCKFHVYTGSVDQLMDFKYGNLEYRFSKLKTYTSKNSPFGCAVMNFADNSTSLTRTIDHNYLNPLQFSNTHVISEEQPTQASNPLEYHYPINNIKNNSLYKKYVSELPQDTFLCGRLGNYKYINIDQAIEAGLSISNQLLNNSFGETES